jgi:hypothetical protein
LTAEVRLHHYPTIEPPIYLFLSGDRRGFHWIYQHSVRLFKMHLTLCAEMGSHPPFLRRKKDQQKENGSRFETD